MSVHPVPNAAITPVSPSSTKMNRKPGMNRAGPLMRTVPRHSLAIQANTAGAVAQGLCRSEGEQVKRYARSLHCLLMAAMLATNATCRSDQ